jgi:hypothetical protein
MTLSVCESVAAIVLHLREVVDGDVNYSGSIPDRMTLCGTKVGWDTKDQLAHANCRDCLTIRTNRENGVGP